MTPRTLRLRDHLDLVRRQGFLIGVVAVGAAVLALAVASLQDEVYASTAAVRIAAVADPASADGAEATANDRTRELVTEVEIIGSTSLADLVRARLGPEPPTFGPVTATLVGFSEVVTIRVEAPDPAVAALVADLYAEVFVEQRRDRVVAPLQEQVDQLSTRADAVRAELARVESLLGTAADDAAASGLRATQDAALVELQELGERIGAFEAAVASGAEATVLVSTAVVEPDPVSPDRTRNGLVGLALGLALGLAAGILRDLVRDRVAGVVDVAAIDPDLPVLAGVPRAGGRGSPDAAVTDAYRGLDAAVRLAAVDRRGRTVAVTSAVDGEQAATVAVELARASAAAGARVALVDCDLRRPSVHEAFGLDAGPGLLEVLRGDLEVDAALRRPVEGLEVLGAGGSTDPTGEMLSGDRFARLVTDLADRVELTVLLAPPVLPVADALWVGRHAGATLVVTRVGTTRRADVVDAVARLRGVAVPILGTVVTDVPQGSRRRAYVAARA